MAKTYIAVVNNSFASAPAHVFNSPDVAEFQDTAAWKHPVFPIIHQTADEDSKVILINLGNENDMKAFNDEMSATGVNPNLVIIDGTTLQHVGTAIDITIEILDHLEDNDEIVAYVSAYANKITDRMVHAALHAAYRLMDNVSIQNIIDVNTNGDTGYEMRDMTALYQIGEITALLKDRKFGTGVKALKMILDR